MSLETPTRNARGGKSISTHQQGLRRIRHRLSASMTKWLRSRTKKDFVFGNLRERTRQLPPLSGKANLPIIGNASARPTFSLVPKPFRR